MAETPRTIVYTHTDEAPALATASLLPIIQAFSAAAGVTVELRDISLGARVLAAFPEFLADDQRVSDDLAELGELVTRPEANVIKLPNISASLPQLVATIEELRGEGVHAPGLPRRAIHSRGARHPGSLRPGQGLGGESGDARGQLGPARRPRRSSSTREAIPTRWAHGRATRRPLSRTWMPTTSARTSSRSPWTRPARCASSWPATTGPSPCSKTRFPCSPAKWSTPP